MSLVIDCQGISKKCTSINILFNHSTFLRLKHINLLGAIGFFQSKEGLSRYDHSIGCANLANLFIENNPIKKEDGEILILAALLHDIGHPPFSHSTELSLYQLFNRYHRGQTNLMLKNHTSYFHNAISIEQAIKNNTNNGPAIFKQVLGLLNSINYDRVLRNRVYQVFMGPMNIDTLDAIPRAAKYFGLKYIDPTDIIGQISYTSENGTMVSPDAIPLMTEFWDVKNAVYKDYIYDLRNQAIEAMVNRAVFLAYENYKKRTPFYLLNDEELVDVLKLDCRSYYLWDLISKGLPFVPVWEKSQPFVNRRGKMNYLTAISSGDRIENWFAEKLNIPKGERYKVIFHVSLNKKYQCNRIDPLPGFLIPWNILSNIYKNKKSITINVFLPEDFLCKDDKENREFLIKQFNKEVMEPY